MLSVGPMCPGCKRPLADHLPSRRRAPEEVPPGKVAVVNGRCVAEGQAAPQKCCWVALSRPMTVQEYVEGLGAGRMPLEPCPGCGGRLVAWGSCRRTLAEGSTLHDLRLRRGRCLHPDCPVCTVTHYPCFVTPYHVVPTDEREAAIRARAERGCSWSELAPTVPSATLGTVQRWVRRLTARAAEIIIGLLALWQRLDPGAPAEVRGGQARGGLLRAMFRVCDGVRGLLRDREGWRAPLPSLAVPRLFRPAAPTPLPVWA